MKRLTGRQWSAWCCFLMHSSKPQGVKCNVQARAQQVDTVAPQHQTNSDYCWPTKREVRGWGKKEEGGRKGKKRVEVVYTDTFERCYCLNTLHSNTLHSTLTALVLRMLCLTRLLSRLRIHWDVCSSSCYVARLPSTTLSSIPFNQNLK